MINLIMIEVEEMSESFRGYLLGRIAFQIAVLGYIMGWIMPSGNVRTCLRIIYMLATVSIIACLSIKYARGYLQPRCNK